MRQWGVPFALVLIYLINQQAGVACDVQKGLYEERTALSKELDSAIVANETSRQEELQAKIKTVDVQYYDFMQKALQASKKGDKRPSESCCPKTSSDPIVRVICNMVLYLNKRIPPDQFVREIPVAPSDLAAIWALDQIASARKSTENARPFGVNGPASLYLSELFALVDKKDKLALEKYLGVYRSADGQYAELMDDQMEKLFLQNQEVVLENWSLFRENLRILDYLQQSLSAEQKRRISFSARKYCTSDPSPCKELDASLNKEGLAH